MNEQISWGSWLPFFDQFSQDNQGRPVSIEVVGQEWGADLAAQTISLTAVDFDPKLDAILLTVSRGEKTFTHTIKAPKTVWLAYADSGKAWALEVITKDNSQTILRFEDEDPLRIKEEILKEVNAAFKRESRIDLQNYPIHMSFSDGILTLEGEMENIAAKKLALELAAAIRGVSGIIDRLRVIPAERMSDDTIRDHVCQALIQEPTLENCDIQMRIKDQVKTLRKSLLKADGVIEVAVEDGIVTLNGQVISLSHKRLCGVLAWWVPGSRDVINGLEVIPSEEDNDEEITDAVYLVLEKDPFVNTDQIRVNTQNRVVTLEGLVPDQSVKEMAEFDAWYVFGVDKVINKLEVQTTQSN
jgi:osmotically-inducible protein OsmY